MAVNILRDPVISDHNREHAADETTVAGYRW